MKNVSYKEEEVLLDESDDRPEIGGGQVSDIHAIDQNPAPVRVVEAKQQVDDGGLAGTSVSHQGDGLTRRGGE